MSWLLPWLTAVVVAGTISGIAIGRWPILRVNRTTIALIGSALLLAIGALSLPQAYAALDLNTLLLLFSMMILNGYLFLAGFFKVVTRRLVQTAHTPKALLALIIIASGVLSALFLNDTVVLMLTPLVLEITSALQCNPLPYLLGLATAANVGSTATITGNPQNIIIGSASGIPYLTFVRVLGPVALIGLVICWIVIVLVYRDEFRHRSFVIPPTQHVRVIQSVLRKSTFVILGMLVLFFVGVSVTLAAFLAAAAMMVTRRLKPERVFETIDWNLLVFFAGLFVVTGALEIQGLTHAIFTMLGPLAHAGLVPFGLIAVVLSNLISNVPAVLLLQHLVPTFPDPQRAWLLLAACATLAGNLTLLGSVANLIVAEVANRWNVQVTFAAYLRVGVPITMLTTVIALLIV